MTDLTIILRSLRSRPFVTITTIATVAVAVALMLVLLSMRDAGRKAFTRGSGTATFIVSGDSSPLTAVLNGIFYANPPRSPLPWSKYEAISKSFPWAWSIPTQLGDSYRGFPALATAGDFLTRFQPAPDQPWKLAEGRFFEKSFEVVLGADAAKGTRLRVGANFFLTHGSGGSREGMEDSGGAAQEHHDHEHTEFPYTVVGILEPTGTPHDRTIISDLESTWIIHAHERRHQADHAITTTGASDLTPEDRKITGILLAMPTREGMRVSAAMQQQFDVLRRDTSIVVAQPEQQIMRLFEIVGHIDQLFIAMAAVVLVAGAVAIMLALASSTELRRRQIAVLRVLGFAKPRIFGLVLTESALLGLAGGAAGILIGILGGLLASAVLRRTLGLVIPAEPQPTWIVVVLAATVVLAAIAGLAPAAMAYRTPVAKSLRPIG